MKFVETRVDGVVDLNETAKRLNAHKRRVYDITNVLEGVELLEKISKNNVRWMPPSPSDCVDGEERTEELNERILSLKEMIRETDVGIAKVYSDLCTLHCATSRASLFLSSQDFRNIPDLKGQRCFVIHAPDDARVSRTCRTDDNRAVTHQFVTSSDPDVTALLYRCRIECTDGTLQVMDLSKGELHGVAWRPAASEEGEDGCKENHSS